MNNCTAHRAISWGKGPGWWVTLDPVGIADFLQKAGVVGLLVFILVGGSRKLWVFGYQLAEMTADRDRWRDLALHAMSQVDRTTGVADRATGVADRAANIVQQRTHTRRE